MNGFPGKIFYGIQNNPLMKLFNHSAHTLRNYHCTIDFKNKIGCFSFFAKILRIVMIMYSLLISEKVCRLSEIVLTQDMSKKTKARFLKLLRRPAD